MRARALLPLLLLLLTAQSTWKDTEVFYPRRAEIASFPREVPLNGVLTFVVTLKRGHHSPVFTVTKPSGTTEYYTRPHRKPAPQKVEFDVGFKGTKGAFRVSLVVDSDRGDTTAAQFTIWAGVKRPEKPPESAERRPQSDYAAEPKGESVVRLERKLFRMINDYRDGRGLKPYPWLEKAAQLAREHWQDFLEIEPRPKKYTHLIPEAGSIADRFMDRYAWPNTIRKFPQRDPKIGPEAICYCSEALAAPWSLEWFFREYLIRESAFRAPLVSKLPTHAAVAVVREKGNPRHFTAVVYVQVNSTIVLADLETVWKEATKLENKARRDPARRAELLDRLARMGDRRSIELFETRLVKREPAVRAAALDGLFLNAPEKAQRWVESQNPRLARAHRQVSFADAVPILKALATVKYDADTRARGEKELALLNARADKFLDSALRLVALGDEESAREDLAVVAKRFAGLPAAERAREKLRELEAKK